MYLTFRSFNFLNSVWYLGFGSRTVIWYNTKFYPTTLYLLSNLYATKFPTMFRYVLREGLTSGLVPMLSRPSYKDVCIRTWRFSNWMGLFMSLPGKTVVTFVKRFVSTIYKRFVTKNTDWFTRSMKPSWRFRHQR